MSVFFQDAFKEVTARAKDDPMSIEERSIFRDQSHIWEVSGLPGPFQQQPGGFLEILVFDFTQIHLEGCSEDFRLVYREKTQIELSSKNIRVNLQCVFFFLFLELFLYEGDLDRKRLWEYSVWKLISAEHTLIGILVWIFHHFLISYETMLFHSISYFLNPDQRRTLFDWHFSVVAYHWYLENWTDEPIWSLDIMKIYIYIVYTTCNCVLYWFQDLNVF